MARAVLACAAVRSVGSAGSGPGCPALEGGRRHVGKLRVRHGVIGDLRGSDLIEGCQGAEPAHVRRADGQRGFHLRRAQVGRVAGSGAGRAALERGRGYVGKPRSSPRRRRSVRSRPG